LHRATGEVSDMKQKWSVRRRVFEERTSRRSALRFTLVLAVLVSVCVVGTFLWLEKRKAPVSKEDEFAARDVPNIVPVSLEKGWVSSEFGMRVHPITGKRRMHTGIDLAVDEGVPVKATADGKVIFAGDGGGYGKLVKIDHGNGIETRYAHNSALKVREGQVVRRGEVVALAGHTGLATGDHLHYEVRVRGEPVNPRKYLPALVEGGRRK